MIKALLVTFLVTLFFSFETVRWNILSVSVLYVNCFYFSLIFQLFLFQPSISTVSVSVLCINCFKCVSHDGDNPACEDPFHNNYSSHYLESPCMGGRKGRDGLFPASDCIKVTGVYGESVRHRIKEISENAQKPYYCLFILTSVHN